MMKQIVYPMIWFSFLSYVLCINYYFGEKTNGTRLAYKETVRYEAIPLMKRVKFFTYSGTSHVPIKAIWCFDFQKSDASINITEGGIGYPYVTLRMKSQKSYRLDYVIDIFV